MKKDLELELMKCQVHANSPYNDGWTQDFYKKQMKLIETKIKRKKREIQNKEANQTK